MKSGGMMKYLVGILVAVGLLLNPHGIVFSQSAYDLVLDSVDDSRFPVVNAYVSLQGPYGIPVMDLTTSNFSLTEDGSTITDFEATPVFQQDLAVVLLIDLSESMGDNLPDVEYGSHGRV